MKKILITGRLIADIEIKNSKAGLPYCKFCILHTEVYGKDQDPLKNKHSEFYNITAFGDRATYVAKYFKKGDLVLIDGTPIMQDYTLEDGAKKVHFVIELGLNNTIELMRHPNSVPTSSNYGVDNKGNIYGKKLAQAPNIPTLQSPFEGIPNVETQTPKMPKEPAQAPQTGFDDNNIDLGFSEDELNF